MHQRSPDGLIVPRLVFRASLDALFRDAHKLILVVVVADFLMWTLLIDFPNKLAQYVEWKQNFDQPAAATAAGWPAHPLALPSHTFSHWITVLIVCTRIFYRRLSPRDTIVEIGNVKSVRFAVVLWQLAAICFLFSIGALIWAVILMGSISVFIERVDPWLPLNIIGTAKETVAVTAALGGAVWATGKWPSRLFLIVPLIVLEKPGRRVLLESWKYTAHSLKEVRLVYTFHVGISLFLLFMTFPNTAVVVEGRAFAGYWLFTVTFLACLVWHAALAVECYAALKARDLEKWFVP